MLASSRRWFTQLRGEREEREQQQPPWAWVPQWPLQVLPLQPLVPCPQPSEHPQRGQRRFHQMKSKVSNYREEAA
jgi:hypothetical protein